MNITPQVTDSFSFMGMTSLSLPQVLEVVQAVSKAWLPRLLSLLPRLAEIEVNPKHSSMIEFKNRAAADKSEKTVKDLIWPILIPRSQLQDST